MRYILATLLVAAVSVPALAKGRRPVSTFPPVTELQNQLNLAPGVALPKLVVWAGRVFQPYYVNAGGSGDGTYIVVIKLRKEVR